MSCDVGQVEGVGLGVVFFSRYLVLERSGLGLENKLKGYLILVVNIWNRVARWTMSIDSRQEI